MPPGKKLTVFNHHIGSAYTLTVGHDGSVSKMAAWRCRDSLGTPPGYPWAGPLGEVGEQRPPETPGWAYSFEAIDGGGVKATPCRLVEVSREDFFEALDEARAGAAQWPTCAGDAPTWAEALADKVFEKLKAERSSLLDVPTSWVEEWMVSRLAEAEAGPDE